MKRDVYKKITCLVILSILIVSIVNIDILSVSAKTETTDVSGISCSLCDEDIITEADIPMGVVNVPRMVYGEVCQSLILDAVDCAQYEFDMNQYLSNVIEADGITFVISATGAYSGKVYAEVAVVSLMESDADDGFEWAEIGSLESSGIGTMEYSFDGFEGQFTGKARIVITEINEGSTATIDSIIIENVNHEMLAMISNEEVMIEDDAVAMRAILPQTGSVGVEIYIILGAALIYMGLLLRRKGKTL